MKGCMLMSKFDKLLAALIAQAHENGEMEARSVDDLLAWSEEVDGLETQILEAWIENDLLKMIIGILIPSLFAFANKAESLDQSLRSGMAHQQGLREENEKLAKFIEEINDDWNEKDRKIRELQGKIEDLEMAALAAENDKALAKKKKRKPSASKKGK